MKIFLCAILLLISSSLFCQVTNKVYIGGSIGTKNYNLVHIGIEQHLLDSRYVLGIGYATNFKDHLLQLKLGWRLFRIKKYNVRTYIYLPPYLNLNLKTGGYNTPFAFEIIKDFKWKFLEVSGSINTDIFSDYAIP